MLPQSLEILDCLQDGLWIWSTSLDLRELILQFVTPDRVEGTDITVPVFNFTETHYILNELVTPAYKLTLFNLTGKVNGGVFKGFAKGEVLFLGASGSKRGLDDWEITYRFAASPNVASLSLGGIRLLRKL
jgi:hypothetical protein